MKINYASDKCGKQLTKLGSMKKPVQSVNEGIKYWCDQCDKQFTELGSMKKHIQSVQKSCFLVINVIIKQKTKDF